jgi:hypothetical protein
METALRKAARHHRRTLEVRRPVRFRFFLTITTYTANPTFLSKDAF